MLLNGSDLYVYSYNSWALPSPLEELKEVEVLTCPCLPPHSLYANVIRVCFAIALCRH